MQFEAKLKELNISENFTPSVRHQLGLRTAEDAAYLQVEDLKEAGVKAVPARKFVQFFGKTLAHSTSFAPSTARKKGGGNLEKLQEQLFRVAAARPSWPPEAAKKRAHKHFPMSACFIPQSAKSSEAKELKRQRVALEKELIRARKKEKEQQRADRKKKQKKKKGKATKQKTRSKRKGKKQIEDVEEEDVEEEDAEEEDAEEEDTEESESEVVIANSSDDAGEDVDFRNRLAEQDSASEIKAKHQKLLAECNWKQGDKLSKYNRLYEQARAAVAQEQVDSAPRTSSGRAARRAANKNNI